MRTRSINCGILLIFIVRELFSHDGAISGMASASNCSRRLSLASNSAKMSSMAHACSSSGAEPKGRMRWRRARVVAQDYSKLVS